MYNAQLDSDLVKFNQVGSQRLELNTLKVTIQKYCQISLNVVLLQIKIIKTFASECSKIEEYKDVLDQNGDIKTPFPSNFMKKLLGHLANKNLGNSYHGGFRSAISEIYKRNGMVFIFINTYLGI